MTDESRFKPTRAGIIGLYQYDEQTFQFGDGRIALRGRNTSGKSKALELLVPFVLDGDIRPHKLDPFGKGDKTMAWNLTGCADDISTRVGYVWMEHERVDEHGDTRRVTVGIGMKGVHGTNDVRRWYWILEGGRVGEDLPLIKHTPQGRYALPRDEFKRALAEQNGELLSTQEAYHTRINELLFGFHSLADYRLMLDLIRELRTPKLSDGLKPRKVTELLTRTLPRVDFDLMRKLGESLEQLAYMQAEVGRLRTARQRVGSFISGNYRDYARATVSDRADTLRRAITRYDDSSSDRRTAEERLETAEGAVTRVTAEKEELDREIQRADGEHEALTSTKDWEHVRDFETAAEDARKAAERAEQSESNRNRAVTERDERAGELKSEQEALDAGRSDLDEVDRDLRAHAEAAGLAGRHEALREDLFGGTVNPDTAINVLRDEATRREELIGDAYRRLDELGTLTSRHDAKRGVVSRLAGELDEARAKRSVVAALVETEEEAAAAAIEIWAEGLRELPMDAALLERTVESALDPAGTHADHPHATAAQTHREGLSDQRATLRAQRDRLNEQIDELQAERDELARRREPVPARRGSLRADRHDTLAPLWLLVDFSPTLDDTGRPHVEAALEEAGLLDALVSAEPRANDSRLLAEPAEGRTLADVLVAAPGDTGVPAEAITAILRSVPYETDAQVSVGPGAFRLGPLHGQFSKPAAQFIGAAARAAHRARLLADLDARLGELRERAGELATDLELLDLRLAELDAELGRFPRLDALHQARVNLARAEQVERQAEQRLKTEQDELDGIVGELEAAREDLAVFCLEHSLPSERDALRHVDSAVREYRSALGSARRALLELERKRQAVDTAARRLRTADEHLERAGQYAGRERGDAERLAAKRDTLEQSIGVDVQELKARVLKLSERRAELREQAREKHEEDKQASVNLEVARAAVDAAEEAFETAEAERQRVLDAFKRLEAADMLVLALADAAPADHAQASEWTYTRTVEVIRSLPADRLRTRPSSTLQSLTNLVQRDCSELGRALAEYDMNVVIEQVDAMTVVKISEGGVERTASALADALEREIGAREHALSAEQQRIFGDTLIEEIAEHLRERINGVQKTVKVINDKLSRCRTGSGKTVSLSWSAGELDGMDMSSIVSLIAGRSIAALRSEQRDALVEFFRRRIDDAREQHVADADGEHATAAYLMEAFDYREWFEFDLHQIDQLTGRREKLTSSRHGTGSGGEQAVLMHMPLFAAAAALYDSARLGIAPRLIALDEALSGIDEHTRPQVMRVTVELDLDVFLTAYEIKPYYPTVPRISVYLLHRVNGEWGVFAEWFEWDGMMLVQRDLEDPQLQVV